MSEEPIYVYEDEEPEPEEKPTPVPDVCRMSHDQLLAMAAAQRR